MPTDLYDLPGDYRRRALLPAGGAGLDIAKDPYQNSFDRAQLPDFSYTPDQNDPELGLLRSRDLSETATLRRNNLNELARGGFLGTSYAIDSMQGIDVVAAKQAEDTAAGVFARRRAEALDSYRKKQAFKEELEMLRLRALIQKDLQGGPDLSGLGRLAGMGIGALAGGPAGAATGGAIGGAVGGIGGNSREAFTDFNRAPIYIDPDQPWLGSY